MRTSCFVLALLAALPAAAQDTAVTPGSDLLELHYLVPGTTTYTVTIVQGPMRQQLGTLTRSFTVDEAAGEATMTMAMDVMGSKYGDTTRVAWPSLAARAHYSENPDRLLHYALADGRLTGEHRPTGGDAESFELTVDGSVYDSASLGDIAAALPLEEGYAVTVPAYEYDAGGVATYTVSVLGSEKLALAGKAPVDVWVVEARRPGHDQTPRLYFDQDTHALVRIRIVEPSGIEVLIDAP
jgi:hypothetical protein